MRVYGSPNNRWPPWLVAVLIFGVLVAVVQLTQNGPRPLTQQFAANPPDQDAGTLPTPPVPTNLAALARTTTARLLGGQAGAPLTEVAQNGSLQIRIASIKGEGEGLRIAGSVTNIGVAPLAVSLDAFRFTDQTGTIYASSGSPATTLAPQQQAPLDMTLPIGNPSQLRLDIEQPGQPQIEMLLLNSAPPAP